MGANPHRGDTPIEVGDGTYTLCYDLNACALIMDKFELTDFEDLAEKAQTGSGMSIADVRYILWAGLQHHHAELTEQEVGGMDWAMDEAGPLLAEAFQKGLLRKAPPEVEKKVTRKKTGTGRKPKSERTRQESQAQASSGD